VSKSISQEKRKSGENLEDILLRNMKEIENNPMFNFEHSSCSSHPLSDKGDEPRV